MTYAAVWEPMRHTHHPVSLTHGDDAEVVGEGLAGEGGADVRSGDAAVSHVLQHGRDAARRVVRSEAVQ